MENKYKFIFSVIFTVILLSAIMLFYFDGYNFGRQRTITLGCFAGSYWNVQNGNSYKLIDNAIKKFEEQNPNVKVEYVSGITKDDYSEWLYGKLLEGNAPDVFLSLAKILMYFLN